MSTVIERAVSWALQIAADSRHGYDQGNRWGPDYDCSSFVISAFKQAGVPLSCTYTGNMKADMLAKGFREVKDGSRQRGDVLLNQAAHTALYVGGGQLVQARINEIGGTTGGQTGDQTGAEIRVQAYYDFPWDCVLRYQESTTKPSSTPAAQPAPPASEFPGTYTVQSGDTLWSIAQSYGIAWQELARINGIANPGLIHAGDVLRLSQPEQEPPNETPPNQEHAAEPAAPVSQSEELDENGTRSYTVQSGDTLWSIAERLLGKGWRCGEIAKLNDLANGGHWIYAGQVLKIPEE